MGIFYILVPDTGAIYALDATTSFDYSETGTLTEFAIESGAKQSDHYVNENPTITVSGIITDVKSPGGTNPQKTGVFIQKLKDLKNQKKSFTFYYRDDAEKGDNKIDDLMFTSLEVSNSPVYGYSFGMYAYEITFGCKKIVYANKAVISTERLPAVKNTTDNIKKDGTDDKKDKAAEKKPSEAATEKTDIDKNKLDPAYKYTRDQLEQLRKSVPQ